MTNTAPAEGPIPAPIVLDVPNTAGAVTISVDRYADRFVYSVTITNEWGFRGAYGRDSMPEALATAADAAAWGIRVQAHVADGHAEPVVARCPECDPTVTYGPDHLDANALGVPFRKVAIRTAETVTSYLVASAPEQIAEVERMLADPEGAYVLRAWDVDADSRGRVFTREIPVDEWRTACRHCGARGHFADAGAPA